ncbi:MAG TPA: YceI family protein [Williamwhitmania sp.]|nr:YceI family protein [Williamwhitmania sp.]
MNKKFAFLLVACLTLLSVQGIGQVAYNLKSFKVVISGTSNLHDWTADVTKMQINSSLDVTSNKFAGISNATVVVDANAIDGSEGSIMDGKIRDALKAEQFPKITFQLTSPINVQPTTGETSATITGKLTIGGTTLPVTIMVNTTILPSGEVQIKGAQKIKMTSFKLAPPTAMFGALKTGDDVVVTYTLVLKKV